MMGLDLSLLPFDTDMPGLSFSHTILSCERDYELFDAVQEVVKAKGRRVPKHFSSYLCRDDKYEEPHYGNTQETPYGEPLMEVEVEDISHFSPNGLKNLSIWNYLRALPPRTKVAIYWH